MKNTVVRVLVIASVLSPAAAFAQAGKTAPTTATLHHEEDIDKVGATEQSQRPRDENVKVIDLGYENFAVGIVHRAPREPRPPSPAAVGAAQAQPCGRAMATLLRADAGRHHADFQTEAISSSPAAERVHRRLHRQRTAQCEQNFPGGPNGPTCGVWRMR